MINPKFAKQDRKTGQPSFLPGIHSWQAWPGTASPPGCHANELVVLAWTHAAATSGCYKGSAGITLGRQNPLSIRLLAAG